MIAHLLRLLAPRTRTVACLGCGDPITQTEAGDGFWPLRFCPPCESLARANAAHTARERKAA